MAVITISREVGSGGDQIARRLCELLGYRYFDKTLMAQVAKEQGVSDTEVVDFSEDSYRVRGFIDALLRRSTRVATATTVGTTTRGERTKLVHHVDEEMAASFVRTTIRALRASDADAVVRIDRERSGRPRSEFWARRFQALADEPRVPNRAPERP